MTGMSTARDRVLLGCAAGACAALLSGCGSAPVAPSTIVTATATPSPGATSSLAASRSSALQLRPVVAQTQATPAQCPSHPASSAPPSAPATACSADRSRAYQLGPAEVTGDRIASARVTTSEAGAVEIDVTLDAAGAAAFATLTAGLAQQPSPDNELAMYVNGVVMSSPTVDQPILGGSLIISGFGSSAEAQAVVDGLQG